jgi:hypothetical protein
VVAPLLTIACSGKGASPCRAPDAVSVSPPQAAAPPSSLGAPLPLERSRDVKPLSSLAEGVSSGGVPARWMGPFPRTSPAGLAQRPPREPVVNLGVGAGWGCVELDATGERYRACWLSSSAAELERGECVVHAKREPWLGGWPATTAERFCTPVGFEVECCTALEVLRQQPASIPDATTWRRQGDARNTSEASSPPQASRARPHTVQHRVR